MPPIARKFQALYAIGNTACAKYGIAMATVLIFMLLLTIIAGASLSVMTKQARLAEHQIRRTKAFFAAEAAVNKAYQSLRYVDIAGAPVGNWSDANGNGVWEWQWNGQFEWDVRNNGSGPGDFTAWDIRVLYNRNLATTVEGGVTLRPREIRAIIDYSP